MVQPLWEMVGQFFKKLKIDYPLIQQFGYVPQRIESRVWRRYLHTRVHSSTIHSSQKVDATPVCVDG